VWSGAGALSRYRFWRRSRAWLRPRTATVTRRPSASRRASLRATRSTAPSDRQAFCSLTLQFKPASRTSRGNRKPSRTELVRLKPCRFRVTPPNRSTCPGTSVRTWYPALHPMRKILHAWFLFFLILSASPVFAAVAQPTAASAASGAAITLTPEQARQALSVLNDPTRRAQVSDTLQAIAAAGVLSAPPLPAAPPRSFQPHSSPTASLRSWRVRARTGPCTSARHCAVRSPRCST
jgi:hypothetical protein